MGVGPGRVLAPFQEYTVNFIGKATATMHYTVRQKKEPIFFFVHLFNT